MLKYSEYENYAYGQIDRDEAGINRLVSKLEDGTDFVIISAYTAGCTEKENIEKNSDLLQGIRKELGCKQGAYKLVGLWKDYSDTDTVHDISESFVEEAWLLEKPEESSSENFLEIISQLARVYEQDAYIIRVKNKLSINSTNDLKCEDLGEVSKETLSYGFERILSDKSYIESTSHKTSMTPKMEALCLSVPKNDISSKMLFHHARFLF